MHRYQKFRKLGQFEEWAVHGADWRGARSERANAAGVQTDAGTWAFSETEASFIKSSVDAGMYWLYSAFGCTRLHCHEQNRRIH